MSKLTKAQAKAHAEAVRVLTKDRLSEDDKWFVLENWREDATHINSVAGAFFTPPMLARDLAIEAAVGRTLVDLCAGIGTLAFFSSMGRDVERIVCVEANPDYAAVGRKLLPQAEWIVADIFDLPAGLGRFDCAVSNPPFGAVKRSGSAPRYSGRAFEFHVIDIASDLADWGAFIIPQGSAPFEYSGRRDYRERQSAEHDRFVKAAGFRLQMNCGIDCSAYRDEWRGVAPAVEIVVADFAEARADRAEAQTPTLFDFLDGEAT